MSPTEILDDAIAARVFPGAVAHLSRENQTLFHGARGALGTAPPFDAPAQTSTVYDLASLTKLYVAAAALRCLRAHDIPIHAPLRQFLPAFDARLTLAHLMNHGSGLELHLQTLRERDAAAWTAILAQTPLQSAPGTRALYACTNYFLLGRALVFIEGAPLQTIVEKYLLEPAHLRASFAPTDLENVAPTEPDGQGGWVRGAVHDEAARAFRAQTGDCAGNAGLFADAADVADFARLWFDDFFHADDVNAISANLLPEASGARGLGFQIDVPFYMSEAAPRGSWGHLGFTGPSVALHRASRSVVVVLNNRVHPTRDGPNRMKWHRALASWTFGGSSDLT